MRLNPLRPFAFPDALLSAPFYVDEKEIYCSIPVGLIAKSRVFFFWGGGCREVTDEELATEWEDPLENEPLPVQLLAEVKNIEWPEPSKV